MVQKKSFTSERFFKIDLIEIIQIKYDGCNRQMIHY